MSLCKCILCKGKGCLLCDGKGYLDKDKIKIEAYIIPIESNEWRCGGNTNEKTYMR